MIDKKYTWTHVSMDKWLKDQAKILQQQGFKHSGTATVSRLLYEKWIIPNNVSMINLIPKKVKIKKRRNIIL